MTESPRLAERVRYRGRQWEVVGSFWNHLQLRAENGDEVYVEPADEPVEWLGHPESMVGES